MELYGVYVWADEAGRVTAINSDAFMADTDGWVKIDSGFGDRYHHAQGNYLKGPVTDERGVCRYRLADGAVVERTAAEMDGDYTPPEPVMTAEEMLAAMMDGIQSANG